MFSAEEDLYDSLLRVHSRQLSPLALSASPRLTESQQQAVEHTNGPLLVIAGPGSGKTRVITQRIARLVDSGVRARRILAITFTNKAAAEMASRVNALLPGDDKPWVSTFHRFCAKLLRKYSEAVGLKPNYTILDRSDQIAMVRQVLHELNFDAVFYNPNRITNRISSAKNELIRADDYRRQFEERVGDSVEAVVAQVYPEYQNALLRTNCVDFDDLLLHVLELLETNSETRESLDQFYKHVLVDEFQDTNLAQYRIAAALSQTSPNLCATGDPDQSIYGWRGARIDNILRFESDFADTHVVRLDQNFRSTRQIVAASDRLVACNKRRKQRSLTTENDDGVPVELLSVDNSEHEAEVLCEHMREQVDAGNRKWSDFAIFYRVNALSRQLEVALGRHQIPFQISAGAAFYDRQEIRDMLAYLRLIENPEDESAFRRIINTPTRGIGKKSLGLLEEHSRRQRVSLVQSAKSASQISGLTARAKKAIAAFVELYVEFVELSAGPVTELLKRIVERTGYVSDWLDGGELEHQRVANLNELLTAANQFEQSAGDDGDLSLIAFLETTALVTDGDNLDGESGEVTLMTMHASKGLEFPVVYIVGVEDGLIPHERSVRSGDPDEIEEERRLLFVGMTRAREELYLTQTAQRTFQGNTRATIPSGFIREVAPIVRDRHQQITAPQTRIEFEPRRVAKERPAGQPLLTTAADLLKGKNTEAEIPQGFAIGSKVRHPRYGVGTVIEMSGMSRRRMVTVRFRDDREQTFVAEKSPLQPVGL